MSTEEATQEVVQSDVLTESELKATVENTEVEQEEVVLPSESAEFVMPEKFKGKSAEDIAKSYLELEKMKQLPTEEVVQQEEATPSEEQPKQEVDPEYEAWKQEKALKETLDPVGGLDTYKEAVEWASTNLPEEEITSFNNAITNSKDPDTVKLLAKTLIDKYKSGTTVPTPPLHGNETSKPTPVSGYETKSDMMKDIGDARYQRDPSFRAKVEAKIAKTDQNAWYASLPTG